MSKKEAKQNCPIKISPRGYDVIAFMARGQNKTLGKTVEDVFDPLFQIASMFHKNFVIEVESSVLHNTVSFTIKGASSFSIGVIPEEELAKKIKELQEQAKRDIEEARKRLELEEKSKQGPEPEKDINGS
jgi:hypothetical protein